MERLNDAGYRDQNGQPYTEVDDFLLALELDAAGVRTSYSIKRRNIEDDEQLNLPELSLPGSESHAKQVEIFQRLIKESKARDNSSPDQQRRTRNASDPRQRLFRALYRARGRDFSIENPAFRREAGKPKSSSDESTETTNKSRLKTRDWKPKHLSPEEEQRFRRDMAHRSPESIENGLKMYDALKGDPVNGIENRLREMREQKQNRSKTQN